MQTFFSSPGLYTNFLVFADGSQRYVLSSSLPLSIVGVFPSDVIYAERGAAFDPVVDTATPVLTSLVPTSAHLGDPTFTLHVHGTGFRIGHEIVWNGSVEPTIFRGPTELTTEINMATAEVAMSIPVAVRNVVGFLSNELTFDLQPPA